jgi:uncharacterized protein (DUF2164 family)
VSPTPSPLQIRLTDDRRERMQAGVREFLAERFDEPLSEFQAAELLDFFVRELGAPIYNQAIQDARRFLQEKLNDLEGEFYEPEEPYAR